MGGDAARQGACGVCADVWHVQPSVGGAARAVECASQVVERGVAGRPHLQQWGCLLPYHPEVLLVLAHQREVYIVAPAVAHGDLHCFPRPT